MAVLLASCALLLAGCATPRGYSDAQLRAEYETHKEAWFAKNRGELEYDVRHILVARREEADAALARIRAGERFEDVAKRVSRDPESAVKGGDLGWAMVAYFIAPFGEAMRKLAPAGRTEAPVQTAFGWHIIEVRAVRALSFPRYEDVKDRIAKQLYDQRVKAR